jgi:fumarate reductase subunit D
MRQGSSYWMFVVHRVSGVALALFLPIHFWALSLGLEMDSFLRWTEQPLVKAAEWSLVVLLATHLGGGLRVLALELLPWTERQKTLTAAAGGLAVAVGLAFALAL